METVDTQISTPPAELEGDGVNSFSEATDDDYLEEDPEGLVIEYDMIVD